MHWRRLALILLIALLILAVAMPAAAADKKKKKKQDGQEEQDPMAGRFGLSISGGGVSSSAGLGFEGRLGLTYYINRYLSTTLAPGFGTYPVEYDQPDGDPETTYLKYVPIDLSLIISPFSFGAYNPYFGPGVGYTYTWWTQKVEDDDGDLVDEDFNESRWSAFVTAGVSASLGGPFVASAGVTYTLPDLSDVDFSEGVWSFGFGGGVIF